jgi:hypothetical protein
MSAFGRTGGVRGVVRGWIERVEKISSAEIIVSTHRCPSLWGGDVDGASGDATASPQ